MNKNNNLLMYIGIGLSTATFIYFFSVTFFTVPAANKEISSLILGYISGVLSAVVSFWFGSSITPIGTSKQTNIDKTKLDNENNVTPVSDNVDDTKN